MPSAADEDKGQRELAAYCWHQLAVAHTRLSGENMSAAQMKDLADWIRSRSSDEGLTKACVDLEHGTLSAEEIAAGYQSVATPGFDPVAYRDSLAPPTPKRAEVDERLSAVLGTAGRATEPQ